MRYLAAQHQLTVRQACRCVRLARTVFGYQARGRADAAVIEALTALAERYPRYGFRKLMQLLRRMGHTGVGWNHKRIYRVYRLLKLHFRRRLRRRRPVRAPQPLGAGALPGACWSVDFMRDSLVGGRTFRTLNLIDDCTRKALWIEIDTSLPTHRVLRALENAIDLHGKPAAIRTDNGPEFTSTDFIHWCQNQGISLTHIQPGKPTQNAFIERFNGTYRTEVLDAHLFDNLAEVQTITEAWLTEYNHQRPHQSLGYQTPSEFAQRFTENSTLQRH